MAVILYYGGHFGLWRNNQSPNSGYFKLWRAFWMIKAAIFDFNLDFRPRVVGGGPYSRQNTLFSPNTTYLLLWVKFTFLKSLLFIYNIDQLLTTCGPLISIGEG